MNDINKGRNPSLDLRVQDLLMAYLRRWRLIALCVIIACTIAWGITFFCMTPMYQASATVFVNNNRDTGDKDGLTSSDLSASVHLVRGYMIMAKSDLVLTEVANELNASEDGSGKTYTPGQLRGAISTGQIDDTIVFAVRVSHKDPNEAVKIANAVAKVVTNKGPEVIEGTSASMLDSAQKPNSPYSPNYSENIMTGAVAGVLVAVAYVTIMFLKDTRIKDENDLTDMFDLPILGRIPNFDDHVTGARYVDPDIEKGGVEA